MKRRGITITALLCLSAFFIPPALAVQAETETTTEQIAKVIDGSISWFKTKDFDLLFGTIADDPDLFMFQPDSTSTIHGIEEFKKLSVIWQDPGTKYLSHEISDLRIHLSQSGDVAWFSAILEDCGEYQGQAGCWKETRWTGVLEKRDAGWVIMQMHFSFAVDKVKAEFEKQANENSAYEGGG